MASLSFLNLFLLLQFAIFIILTPSSSHAHLTRSKNQVALFIFGDSYFDPGNNNYINTTTLFQSNYPPYGETFFNSPTGRASDGRLIPDFIAEYAKLPLIPPYLQPGNHHLFTNGVNFASGGGGALVQTNQGMVVDLNMQLIYFKNVVKSLGPQLGEKEAKKKLSRAVYLFDIGTNDYFFPFLTNSSVFQLNSQQQYVEMVIGNITSVIKEIYEAGGRKFGFVSLGPLECLPLMRALNLENTGECIEEIATLVKLHNIALSKALKKLEIQLDGFKYSNFDLYNSVKKRMDNPSKYGFKEGISACCGSGRYRGVNTCGGRGGMKEYELCGNASDYIFFDAVHPTEAANEQLAQLMWRGNPKIVWPHNLEALFEQV